VTDPPRAAGQAYIKGRFRYFLENACLLGSAILIWLTILAIVGVIAIGIQVEDPFEDEPASEPTRDLPGEIVGDPTGFTAKFRGTRPFVSRLLLKNGEFLRQTVNLTPVHRRGHGTRIGRAPDGFRTATSPCVGCAQDAT
jgi:hypothetical protein